MTTFYIFFETPQIKKGKKSTKVVQKGTQKFPEKNLGTLLLWTPKRLEKQ